MSFTADISRITAKTTKTAEQMARGIIIHVFQNVIKDTPVDTGRLRGNWQTTANAPATGTTSAVQKGRDGVATADVMATVTGPGIYYLTNNLPYAETAEYGRWGTGAGATVKTTRDGYSVQAPRGMVRQNVKRLERVLRRASR